MGRLSGRMERESEWKGWSRRVRGGMEHEGEWNGWSRRVRGGVEQEGERRGGAGGGEEVEWEGSLCPV